MVSKRVMPLPPIPTIKEILRMYQIRAKKYLSQNFLLGGKEIRRFVGAAGNLEGHHVCEVGPGPGGLTHSILEAGVERLAVVEKDQRFIPALQTLNDASGGRMDIYRDDILSFNTEHVFPKSSAREWRERTPDLHIIGNLPFNVSTPLIIKWLREMAERRGAWAHGRVPLTLAFQREVGERLVCEPGLRLRRSRLSIMAQYLCVVRLVFVLPGSVFTPPPDVDVAIVRFTPRVQPLIRQPYPLVDRLVSNVFQHKGKYCRYGVNTLWPLDRATLTDELFERAGVNPVVRSYQLTIPEFSALCDAYRIIIDANPELRGYDYRSQENALLRKTTSVNNCAHAPLSEECSESEPQLSGV